MKDKTLEKVFDFADGETELFIMRQKDWEKLHYFIKSEKPKFYKKIVENANFDLLPLSIKWDFLSDLEEIDTPV